jgi:hypothetical protein
MPMVIERRAMSVRASAEVPEAGSRKPEAYKIK